MDTATLTAYGTFLSGIGNFFTPIATLLGALIVFKQLSVWKKQKLIEKRLEKYETIFEGVNQLYTYTCRIGGAAINLSPKDILEKKRHVDKAVHLSRALFTEEWFTAYQTFIKQCYREYTGHGEVAKLNVYPHKFQDVYAPKQSDAQWQSDWNQHYFDLGRQNAVSDATVEERENQITQAYNHFVEAFRKDIDLEKIKPNKKT